MHRRRAVNAYTLAIKTACNSHLVTEGAALKSWLHLSTLTAANVPAHRQRARYANAFNDIAIICDAVRNTGNNPVKRAFCMSFYFLQFYGKNAPRPAESFEEAIRIVCQQGGDADTNACIVGGMMGALFGLSLIPRNMLNKVLRFDCRDEFQEDENGKTRPEWLSLMLHALPNIESLLNTRPNNKLIIEEDGVR